jgi:hypothetical protein
MRLPAERQCIFPDHGKLVACCPRGAYLWAASPPSPVSPRRAVGSRHPKRYCRVISTRRERTSEFPRSASLCSKAAVSVFASAGREACRAARPSGPGRAIRRPRSQRQSRRSPRRRLRSKGACRSTRMLRSISSAGGCRRCRPAHQGRSRCAVSSEWPPLQCPGISRLPLGRTTARRCADPSRRSTRKFAVAMRIVDCDMRRIADMDVSSCLKFERRFCNT